MLLLLFLEHQILSFHLIVVLNLLLLVLDLLPCRLQLLTVGFGGSIGRIIGNIFGLGLLNHIGCILRLIIL